MTYKETLFFIGKSLTINKEIKNKIWVEAQIKDNLVDWDAVVKVSTGHFVFPALYCNLKKANFLHYVPADLVAYMKHITDLNRERNKKIITQAKEIRELLMANKITPIFLKGTGNLLEGLYEDIAERMVGDIDFIVSKQEYHKTILIIESYGYKKKSTDHSLEFKHYPKLHKTDGKNIAALEIHKELLTEKYAKEFNYDRVRSDIQILNKSYVLSYSDQLSLSIIAKQINDKGMYYKNISLRNSYDIFLLSFKANTLKSIISFAKLFNPLNNYLAITNETMGYIKTLEYHRTYSSKVYSKIFNSILNDKIKRKKSIKVAERKIALNRSLIIFKKIFYNYDYRRWVFVRARDKKWKQEQLLKLGFKKNTKS